MIEFTNRFEAETWLIAANIAYDPSKCEDPDLQRLCFAYADEMILEFRKRSGLLGK